MEIVIEIALIISIMIFAGVIISHIKRLENKIDEIFNAKDIEVKFKGPVQDENNPDTSGNSTEDEGRVFTFEMGITRKE
jgi:hypothetical protein